MYVYVHALYKLLYIFQIIKTLSFETTLIRPELAKHQQKMTNAATYILGLE